MTVALVAGLPARASAAPSPHPAVGQPVTEAATATAALAAAKESGQPVEVSSARSELTQVFAQPSGQLRLESAVEPQRARRADGSWAPVDLDLARAGDGSLRPKVSVADVRFSGGGTGPLVALAGAGGTLTMSWPEPLPPPLVSGESATYVGVLPDVDLVVRATRTGFTHVLIVKTPAAAENPAVREIRLKLGGTARVTPVPGGGLRATAGDRLLAFSQPAVMWDSTTTTPARAVRAANQVGPLAAVETAGSTSEMPGDAARRARVATEVTEDGDLLLTPDLAMLTPEDARFPIYVDPPWSTGKSRWAYAASNNGNNSDAVARAMVGLNPATGARYRPYFDFPISAIRGKHIESAYVQMKLDHSWSCDDTYTHMYNTTGIASTPRTKWAPTNKKWMAATASHGNEASGCVDSPQTDMTVNFRDGSVTSVIQDHATKQGTLITIGFCACNADGEYESTQDRWKKFFPANAKLVVDYSSYPGKPSGLQVSGVSCPASGRVSIGTLTPTLSAVYPDADGTQALAASFEWLEIPASGSYNDSTPRKPAPGTKSVPAGGRATSAGLSGVAAGKAYAWRTRATDPAPYNLTGAWSAWCEFTTDNGVPPRPDITAAALPDGPGKAVTFEFSSTASDVVKFRYGWTSPPLKEVVASTTTSPTGTTIKTATATLTAARYGQNTLFAYAIDATGNKGNDSSFEFVVGRPSPAVASWGLETHPGVDRAAALADRQPALAGDTPLNVTNVGWADDVRLIGGQTPAFDNNSALEMNTSAPVVDPNGSFSVAAWLRIKLDGQTLPTVNKAAVVQKGDRLTSFGLGYRGSNQRWALWLHLADIDNSPTVWVTSPNAPVVGAWTHLAGVYDAAERQLRLYVNGQQVASTEVTTAPSWSTARSITLGQDLFNRATTAYWKGSIADVQLFNRVLVGHDFTGQLASDPESGGFDEPGILAPTEVGRWDFNAASPCYEVGIPDTCSAPYSGTWPRYLSLTQGADVGLGQRDAGLLLDSTHWVDDPADPYFETATQEYGRSQRNAAPEGDLPQWVDTPVLRTDQSFTVSAWVRLNRTDRYQTVASQDGADNGGFYLYYATDNGGVWKFKVLATATAAGDQASFATTPAADLDEWHQLVGVLDVAARQIRLYVDGMPAATTTLRSDWQPWQADGPFTVGRTRVQGVTKDWLDGALDDVTVYQGPLTDGAVALLYRAQSAQEQP